MDRFADDGKLGQGFTSADDLVEVEIYVMVTGLDLLLLVLSWILSVRSN